jgi:alkylated DNA nucleotide flippase Atl1
MIGSTVRIRITHECEVCKVLRRYVDPDTFRNLPGRRGSLGVFLRGGRLAPGDPIVASEPTYPEVPDAIYERVAWVVERVPAGKVVTYDRLLTLVGAQRAFFRVLPTYLKRAAATGLPAHRVLTSAGTLTGHVPAQREHLEAEGVELRESGEVGLDAAQWNAEMLYLSIP